MAEKFLRYKDLSLILGISTKTISQYRWQNKLPFIENLNGVPGCRESKFTEWMKGNIKI